MLFLTFHSIEPVASPLLVLRQIVRNTGTLRTSAGQYKTCCVNAVERLKLKIHVALNITIMLFNNKELYLTFCRIDGTVKLKIVLIVYKKQLTVQNC